jgi:hypothetical protein
MPRRKGPPPPSGAELIARLRAAADKRGMELRDYALPLAPANIISWLSAVEGAARPKDSTVSRIEALLAGVDVPSPGYRRGQGREGTITVLRRVHPEGIDAATVPAPRHRDPCTWCGTRADIGCKHQPASTPEAFA